MDGPYLPRKWTEPSLTEPDDGGRDSFFRCDKPCNDYFDVLFVRL